ncbi:MAG: hypothetical protein H0U92_04355 [Actinobacteria bacterium]|nr:hypothetical protein [Actinomycetota bacterium]
MSLVKLIPPWLHGVADYSSAALLLVVSVLVDGTAEAKAVGIGVGLTILLLSVFTRYRLGVIRVVPFKVHAVGDYAAGALLLLGPLVAMITDTDRGLTYFFWGVGAALIGGSLLTNYDIADRELSDLSDR